MLKTSKQITLNGSSSIGGTVVVSFNATIPSETGVGNINRFIQNSQLYDANKAQIRRDEAEFTGMVYDIEDQMAAEAPAEEPVPTEEQATT